MNSQKKRLVVYSLFIFSGFLGAYFFLRKKNNPSTSSTENTIFKKDSLISATLLSEYFDLENNYEAFISTEKKHSGKQSCKLSPSIEYGVSIVKNISEIPSFNNLKNISITYNCLNGSENPDALYVLSIDDNKGKNVFWAGEPILYNVDKDWKEATVSFLVAPEFLNPNYKITIYPWNRNKKEFYIDDIHVDYIGTAVYKNEESSKSETSNLIFDFETDAGMQNADNVKETTAHSGKKACDLSGGKEYGPSINKKIGEISSVPLKKISLSVWVYPLTDNPNTVLVASVVNSKNETVFWEGKSTEGLHFQKNKWTKINASCILPIEKLSSQDILGVSVWNKGKTDVIVDDLEIVYGDSPERRGSPSTVDATAIYEKRFVGEKNKPPFKTIYFEKQELKKGDDNFSPNDDFFVGDFFIDKNSLEEVLCVKNSGAELYSYSPENKQFKKLWGTELHADSIWGANNDFYSGDFNSDGKLDILFVNKDNNDWGIINFNGKEWITISQGKNPKREWLAKNEIPKVGILSKTDKIYPGNYFGNKQTFLKLNTDWRFDLKLLEKDASGYTILGNVDFKGYPKDYNPKYYEFIKIVSGKFLSKDKTSLLVVMCNCADADFKGTHCNTVDNLTFLPNSTQVYTISK